VALRRPGAPPQVRDLGENLLAVNLRHERLIDGLLTLARSEQAITVRDPIDLADIARHVADQNGAQVTTDLAPAPTAGDPILLERVAQNLVKNALDYNTADGCVSVTTATRDGRAELIVRNTGPRVRRTRSRGCSSLSPAARSGGGRRGHRAGAVHCEIGRTRPRRRRHRTPARRWGPRSHRHAAARGFTANLMISLEKSQVRPCS
jgi:hypothetical protein